MDEASLTFLSPLVRPSKIICLGLNYRDHAEESGLGIPEFPVLFARFPSSLMGHGAPIILPKVSSQLDWEAELVAVLSKGGKNIAETDALNHVAGYSAFNDASIRDYQLRTPQWTAGKNFDDTGAFGPWLVRSADVGPSASAFWRMALAIPFLFLIAAQTKQPLKLSRKALYWTMILSGAFFALDLAA